MDARADGGPEDAEVRIHGSLPGCCVGSYGGILIGCWRSGASHEQALIVDRALHELVAEGWEQVGNLHLVEAGSPLPDAKARSVFVRLMNELANRSSASALVLEGHGRWASAIRSFAVGLRLLVRRSVRMELFTSRDEAIRWLTSLHEERLGQPVNRAGLARAIAAIESRARG